MYQSYPSGSQPAGPLPPSVPVPVRTAVNLMYAGAAVSTVNLISGLGAPPRLPATCLSGGLGVASELGRCTRPSCVGTKSISLPAALVLGSALRAAEPGVAYGGI